MFAVGYGLRCCPGIFRFLIDGLYREEDFLIVLLSHVFMELFPR